MNENIEKVFSILFGLMNGYVDDLPDIEIFKLSMMNKMIHSKVKSYKNQSGFGIYHNINLFIEKLYSKPDFVGKYTNDETNLLKNKANI